MAPAIALLGGAMLVVRRVPVLAARLLAVGRVVVPLALAVAGAPAAIEIVRDASAILSA